ncbi:hypothetical protein Y032_0007g3318 [Ancylostoma ceylanicum]|uniref:Transposable element Tc3 transposase-like DNA-binding HTH domain-containing protein n=1 Tax=Ancylostoma ceylanicum TaxID=53326 RepID=A0A016VMJ4_9BILA|nr:hypothetical protein Y032_0007g3318 [Ancylostoma ceylanicum]
MRNILQFTTRGRYTGERTTSCLSPNKIRAELKVTVSESTDWRALHRSGNVASEIVKKAPRLTFRHKTAQLEFA